MRVSTTTDLERVRAGEQFIWGKPAKIHDVGRYTILQLEPTFVTPCPFYIYVDGKYAETAAATLEGALMLAIALGNGQSHEAARCAALVLKLPEVC